MRFLNKKITLIFCLIVVFIFSFAIQIFAHSGKTDTDGGHWNHSADTYHWHHGYSEHQHYDKDGDGYKEWCPYTSDYNCGHEDCTVKGPHGHINKDKEQNSSGTKQPTNSQKGTTWKNIIGWGIVIIVFSPFVLSVFCVIWFRIIEPLRERKRK